MGEGNGTKVEKAELEAEIVEQREGSEKVAEEPMPEIVEERESEVEEAQGAEELGEPRDVELPYEEAKGGKVEGPFEGEKRAESPRDMGVRASWNNLRGT